MLLSRMLIFSRLSIALVIFSFLFGCSSSKDPVTGEKKVVEVNPQAKAKEFAKKGGGIFGDFTKNKSTTYDFATSNVMWRATLKTLNFMPLQAIDYSGGIISTDWYAASSSNYEDSIKITVRFLSDQVSVSSIEITSHKKTCEKNFLKCKVSKLNQDFNDEIKNKIMKEVVALSVEKKKEDSK